MALGIGSSWNEEPTLRPGTVECDGVVYGVQVKISTEENDKVISHLMQFDTKYTADKFVELMTDTKIPMRNILHFLDNKIFGENHQLIFSQLETRDLEKIKIEVEPKTREVITHNTLFKDIDLYNLEEENLLETKMLKYSKIVGYRWENAPVSSLNVRVSMLNIINNDIKKLESLKYTSGLESVLVIWNFVNWNSLTDVEKSWWNCYLFEYFEAILNIGLSTKTDMIVLKDISTPIWIVEAMRYLIKSKSKHNSLNFKIQFVEDNLVSYFHPRQENGSQGVGIKFKDIFFDALKDFDKF